MVFAQLGQGCGPTVLLTWESTTIVVGALLGLRGLRSRRRERRSAGRGDVSSETEG